MRWTAHASMEGRRRPSAGRAEVQAPADEEVHESSADDAEGVSKESTPRVEVQVISLGEPVDVLKEESFDVDDERHKVRTSVKTPFALPHRNSSSMHSNAANLLNAAIPLDVPTKRVYGETRPILDREPGVVVLNVYDLTQLGLFRSLNEAMLPLVAGGLFHVGVEVWHHEYSYGFTHTGPGIYRILPRNDPDHEFRESISLGVTKYSRPEVYNALRNFMREWRGADYHWARKNCLHFAHALVDFLGVGPVPGWVDQFSRGAGKLSLPIDGAVESFKAMTVTLESMTGRCKTCKPIPSTRLVPDCCGSQIVVAAEHNTVTTPDIERRV